MYIYWLGESSFKIKTDSAVVVVDPSAKKTGLSQTSLEADIVIISNTMETDIKRVIRTQKKEDVFIIDSPGEYEKHSVFVYALDAENGSLLTLTKADGIEIAHLAGLSEQLNDRQLSLMEGADITLIPVGGNGVLTGKQADQAIAQIEPKMVIPMNYEIPKITTVRAPVSEFLSEMGVKDLEPQTSLHITKAKLPQEEMLIVLLQP